MSLKLSLNQIHFQKFLLQVAAGNTWQVYSKPNIKIMQSTEGMALDAAAGDHWTRNIIASSVQQAAVTATV